MSRKENKKKLDQAPAIEQEKIDEDTKRRRAGVQDRFSKPDDVKGTLLRLWRYLSYQKTYVILGLIMVSMASLGGVAGNAFLRPIINILVYENERGIGAIVPYLIILGIIYLIAASFQYLGNRFMVQLAQRTTNRIRGDLFKHMQKLPISFFDTRSHGELMSAYTNDVDNINQALDQSLVQIFTNGITFIGTFTMMLVLSPILTLFVVIMVIIMLFIVRFVTSRSGRNFRAQQANLADLNGYIEEMMEGQKVVKVFNHEEVVKEEFAEKNEALRVVATDAQTYSVVLFPIMGSLSFVQYAITAMGGAIMLIRFNMLDVGTIASFLQYSREFSRPITMISNQLNILIAALAGAERVFRILDEEVEIDDGDVVALRLEDVDQSELRGQEIEASKRGYVWRVPETDGSVSFKPVLGDIRFNNVYFGYNPERLVLKDISLYAKPGQKIAFVGSTGAGKTTITNLINRFYDIQGGEILLDGIQISRIKKTPLRRMLGMVLQDVHLFEGTIADNIRYGRLDATDEEVRQAAQIANAESFIMVLPNGYDTELTSDGGNLSQGQRQLLSIARAAVADPLILIMDEATSSIDTRTERLIEQGMDTLMEGRTVFAIAHRLSTVRHSNAIMVLEEGEIIERGDHDQLIEAEGRYYDLNMGVIELA